jgi:hypothetical protein
MWERAGARGTRKPVRGFSGSASGCTSFTDPSTAIGQPDGCGMSCLAAEQPLGTSAPEFQAPECKRQNASARMQAPNRSAGARGRFQLSRG